MNSVNRLIIEFHKKRMNSVNGLIIEFHKSTFAVSSIGFTILNLNRAWLHGFCLVHLYPKKTRFCLTTIYAKAHPLPTWWLTCKTWIFPISHFPFPMRMVGWEKFHGSIKFGDMNQERQIPRGTFCCAESGVDPFWLETPISIWNAEWRIHKLGNLSLSLHIFNQI